MDQEANVLSFSDQVSIVLCPFVLHYHTSQDGVSVVTFITLTWTSAYRAISHYYTSAILYNRTVNIIEKIINYQNWLAEKCSLRQAQMLWRESEFLQNQKFWSTLGYFWSCQTFTKHSPVFWTLTNCCPVQYYGSHNIGFSNRTSLVTEDQKDN